MADRKPLGSQGDLKNPLLFGAGINVTFEELTQTAQLMPQPAKPPTNLLPTDVGEVDSFLGEDAPSILSGLPAPPPRQNSPKTSLPSCPGDYQLPPYCSGSSLRLFNSPSTSSAPVPSCYSSEVDSVQNEEGDQLKQIPLGDSVPLYDPASIPAPIQRPHPTSRIPSRPYSPLRTETNYQSNGAGPNSRPPINSTPPTNSANVGITPPKAFNLVSPILSSTPPPLVSSPPNVPTAHPVFSSVTLSSNQYQASQISTTPPILSTVPQPLASSLVSFETSSPNIFSTPPILSTTAPPLVSCPPPFEKPHQNLFKAAPTYSTSSNLATSPPVLGTVSPNLYSTAPVLGTASPQILHPQPLEKVPPFRETLSIAPSIITVPPLLDTASSQFSTAPINATLPTFTAVPPTLTAVPPTLTAVPPTLTAVPPTLTAVPPILTVPPTLTSTPQILSVVPPTLFTPLTALSTDPLPTVSSTLNFSQPVYSTHSANQSIFPPTIGTSHSAFIPPTAGVAPPKGSGSVFSYRLGNLKRPTYAPPPDLNINNRTYAIMAPTAGQQQHQEDLHHQQPVHQQVMNHQQALHHHQPQQPLGHHQQMHPQLPLFTPPPVPQLERTASVTLEATPPASATFPAAVQGMTYRPVYHHWFFRKSGVKSNAMWEPFSMADSLNLEQAFTSGEPCELNDTIVATDGGRYDVDISQRNKIAVFWEEPPSEVRQCSWFLRDSASSRYIPYDENIAALLEEEYKNASLRNEWNKRVELSDGEVIILHGPSAIAHHQRSSSPDPWGNPPTMQFKPRVVKRGLDEFDIPEGEPSQVDHLLLVVHGIGKVCDLRFRSLVEVVDDFRAVSMQLIQSHFKSGCERGAVGRVEVLPVEWHRALHTEAIDQRLSDITLPSIPKAREFTNETLLDILFYTSPVFCEKIVQAVGAELNRVYSLYLERNPGFKGGVFLGGHSLGSLILFDMLCHQRPSKHHQHLVQQTSVDDMLSEDVPEQGHLGCLKTKARLSRRMSYLTIGTAGAGQPYIIYPQLMFQPKAFFALGSPIGMFVTVRGIEALGEDFKFPTCPAFFNIFHPYDPVAYRIEGLISPDMAQIPAVLIPHHKGRKRMHLELKDTMAHVTAALKQKLLDSFRNTWNAVYQIAMFHRSDQAIEHEVEKVLENEMRAKDSERIGSIDCGSSSGSGGGGGDEMEGLDVKVGSLNGGRRIDYVLQEAPLETFNQYISAVRSHVVYWESEDTMLMILKELYQTIGISTDSQVPQPILPFDISSEDYADPGKAYTHYTESTTLSPVQEFTD